MNIYFHFPWVNTYSSVGGSLNNIYLAVSEIAKLFSKGLYLIQASKKLEQCVHTKGPDSHSAQIYFYFISRFNTFDQHLLFKPTVD